MDTPLTPPFDACLELVSPESLTQHDDGGGWAKVSGGVQDVRQHRPPIEERQQLEGHSTSSRESRASTSRQDQYRRL